MYDFPCEHCDGTVRERLLDREAIRHKGDFVILENVPIGICEKCGAPIFSCFGSKTRGRDWSWNGSVIA